MVALSSRCLDPSQNKNPIDAQSCPYTEPRDAAQRNLDVVCLAVAKFSDTILADSLNFSPRNNALHVGAGKGRRLRIGKFAPYVVKHDQ
jgi:hypothetical protein